MRYVMVTYASPTRRDWWKQASADAKREHIERVRAWFRRYGEQIDGGEELGDPGYVRTLRKGSITDGPFIETKEAIGGFIVLDTPDEATALQIASEWPSLAFEGDAVELRLAGDSVAEADAQAAAEATG